MAGIIRMERGVRRGTAYYHFNDGFFYHLNRERVAPNGNRRLYLRCIYFRTRRCRGAVSAVVADDNVVRADQVPHTCPPDPLLVQVRQLRHDILDEVRLNRDIFQQPVFIMTRMRAR